MSPSPEPYPRPLSIAHRGWHNVHVENTLDAFQAAYDAGCDMVEFDVQLSRDGVPVIFHDDDGHRLAGRREMIHDLDWRELRDWTMPGKGNPSGYKIPSLEQFLSRFGTKAFYLELKVPKAKGKDEGYLRSLGERCASLVQSSSPRPETFLASFHMPLLASLAKSGAYPRLVGIFEDLERYRYALDGKAPIERYSLPLAVWRGYSKSAAPKINPGPKPDRILLWNLKTEAEMRMAAAEGVYGLCADAADLLVRVCGSGARGS